MKLVLGCLRENSKELVNEITFLKQLAELITWYKVFFKKKEFKPNCVQ